MAVAPGVAIGRAHRERAYQAVKMRAGREGVQVLRGRGAR